MHKDLYPVPADVAARAWIDNAKYLEMYGQSIEDPEGFWVGMLESNDIEAHVSGFSEAVPGRRE